jgi:hypothetical protein
MENRWGAAWGDFLPRDAAWYWEISGLEAQPRGYAVDHARVAQLLRKADWEAFHMLPEEAVAVGLPRAVSDCRLFVPKPLLHAYYLYVRRHMQAPLIAALREDAELCAAFEALFALSPAGSDYAWADEFLSLHIPTLAADIAEYRRVQQRLDLDF